LPELASQIDIDLNQWVTVNCLIYAVSRFWRTSGRGLIAREDETLNIEAAFC